MTVQISAKHSIPSSSVNSSTSSETWSHTSNILRFDHSSGACMMKALKELLFVGFLSMNRTSPKPYLSLKVISVSNNLAFR